MKTSIPLRPFTLFVGVTLTGVLASCHLPPAHAETAYGARIVAPQHDENDSYQQYVYDTSEGPAIQDLQSSLEKMTGAKFTAVIGEPDPGDALIHHSQILHRSEPNTSKNVRLGLLMVFCGAHTQTDPN